MQAADLIYREKETKKQNEDKPQEENLRLGGGNE